MFEDKMEDIMRCFLCFGTKEILRILLVWDHIFKPKKWGGIGLRSIISLNKMLHLKNIWRLIFGQVGWCSLLKEKLFI
jgi:hypothetical protein